MSLVTDALRKARHDAQQPRTPAPGDDLRLDPTAPTMAAAPRRTPWTPITVGAAAGVLVVGASLAITVIVMRSAGGGPARAQAAATEAPRPTALNSETPAHPVQDSASPAPGATANALADAHNPGAPAAQTLLTPPHPADQEAVTPGVTPPPRQAAAPAPTPAAVMPATQPDPSSVAVADGRAAATVLTTAPATQSATVAAPVPPPPKPELTAGAVYVKTLDVAGLPLLTLDGIVYSTDRSAALINGAAAAVGDDLGGVTVLEIETRRVKLHAQNKDFFLRLP